MSRYGDGLGQVTYEITILLGNKHSLTSSRVPTVPGLGTHSHMSSWSRYDGLDRRVKSCAESQWAVDWSEILTQTRQEYVNIDVKPGARQALRNEENPPSRIWMF